MRKSLTFNRHLSKSNSTRIFSLHQHSKIWHEVGGQQQRAQYITSVTTIPQIKQSSDSRASHCFCATFDQDHQRDQDHQEDQDHTWNRSYIHPLMLAGLFVMHIKGDIDKEGEIEPNDKNENLAATPLTDTSTPSSSTPLACLFPIVSAASISGNDNCQTNQSESSKTMEIIGSSPRERFNFIADIVDKAAPSVVHIKVSGRMGLGMVQSSGSGFIVSQVRTTLPVFITWFTPATC